MPAFAAEDFVAGAAAATSIPDARPCRDKTPGPEKRYRLPAGRPSAASLPARSSWEGASFPRRRTPPLSSGSSSPHTPSRLTNSAASRASTRREPSFLSDENFPNPLKTSTQTAQVVEPTTAPAGAVVGQSVAGDVASTGAPVASWHATTFEAYEVSTLDGRGHDHRRSRARGRLRGGRTLGHVSGPGVRRGERRHQRERNGQPVLLRTRVTPSASAATGTTTRRPSRRRDDHAHYRRPHPQRPGPPGRALTRSPPRRPRWAAAGRARRPNFAGIGVDHRDRPGPSTSGRGPATSRSAAARSIPEDETTLDGYTGTLTVSANGDGTDAVDAEWELGQRASRSRAAPPRSRPTRTRR